MTATRRLLLWLVGLTGAWTALPAQTLPDVIVEHYTTAQGLPCNNVACTLKDRDGFLWLGTWYGLCRFDGAQFLTLNKQMPGSDVPPRKVESMAADGNGNLWLKTVDWKLYVYYPRQNVFRAVNEQLKRHAANLQVIKLQATAEGRILLLTKDKTLLAASTQADTTVSIRPLFNARRYTDPHSYQLLHDVTTVSGDYLVHIGRDYRIGALRLARGESPAQAAARMAQADSSLARQTERMQAVATAAGIGKPVHIFLDTDSMLWIATPNSGLYSLQLQHRQFRIVPLPEGNPAGARAFFQTASGAILVGTRSRNLYVYDTRGQLLRTLSYEQLPIGAVYHIMEDRQGRLWFSTKGDGLVVATPDGPAEEGRWKQLRHYRNDPDDPESLSGDDVYMTYTDARGHVWVGTLDGGLNLVGEHDGRITFYNRHNQLGHYPGYGLYNEVRNMAEDQQGRLWIGTIDGLMSLSTDFRRPADIRFQTYRDASRGSFANNDIYTMYRDRQGQLWVGAFGGGLSRLDGFDRRDQLPVFTMLGMREGMRSDIIRSIQEDRQGRIWLGTEVGIACYDPQTERIRNFDRNDGVPDQLGESATLLTRQGDIWMGCAEGMVVFQPDRIRPGSLSYRTFIVRLTVNNRPWHGPMAIPYTQAVRLRHDEGMFTIDYAALNYHDQHAVSYRYRLEGYDQEWHYAGTQRTASYTRVPPGRYTFVVETIDDVNPSLHSAATLQLHILPPWWATWWAWLLYACLAAAVAAVVVRTVLQMNRMRNEIYISQRLARLTSRPDTEGDEFIDQLHRIIQQNIGNSDFNIDSCAASLGLSRSAFFKKVKAQTGFAPLDLIKEFRLSHAAELLQTTHLTITEVAYRSGFKDAGYFSKCFRKRFSVSPREYLAQAR